MERETVFDRLRGKIGVIAFRLFLWSIRMKKEDYWQSIYRDEVRYREHVL